MTFEKEAWATKKIITTDKKTDALAMVRITRKETYTENTTTH